MSTKEDLEALKLALKSEQDGYEFYKKAEARVVSPLAKPVFSALAKDEFEHIRIIRKFCAALEKDLEWPSLDKELEGMTTQTKTVFEKASEELAERIKVGATDSEAYKAALQLENEAYTLYARLLQEAEDAKAKELYRFMGRLEMEHWNFLADTLLFLDNPQQWFFLHEKPIIEG